jgi:hypothetical protein
MVRLYSPRRLSVVGKLDSKRGVITALRPSTDRNVDLGIVQANGRPGGSTADGRCADRVPVKGVPKIVPGWVDSPARMVSAERIGPILSEQAGVGGSRFRRKPRIV